VRAEQVKRLLKAVKYTYHRVNQLEDQLAILRSMREKVTPTLSMVPGGGGNGNRIEELTVRIMELEEEQRGRILSYLDTYQRVKRLIESLPKEEQVMVLSLRYLEGEYWEDISHSLHYSRKQVFRIHDEALLILAEKMKDDTK